MQFTFNLRTPSIVSKYWWNKSNLNQGRLTDTPLPRTKTQWFPLETIWFLIGWQYYRQPMRNQIVSRGNHRIMVRGKGTSVSRPWFKLDFSGDNWWCPLLNILIWIAILVQIKKAISKRFSLNKWMILFQIYVNVANLIGELSIGCQYNCTPCWMKVCFNKERFEWSLKITCICQGCRRFLTISDPRWDQPISDIFIQFCLWAAYIGA